MGPTGHELTKQAAAAAKAAVRFVRRISRDSVNNTPTPAVQPAPTDTIGWPVKITGDPTKVDPETGEPTGDSSGVDLYPAVWLQLNDGGADYVEREEVWFLPLPGTTAAEDQVSLARLGGRNPSDDKPVYVGVAAPSCLTVGEVIAAGDIVTNLVLTDIGLSVTLGAGVYEILVTTTVYGAVRAGPLVDPTGFGTAAAGLVAAYVAAGGPYLGASPYYILYAEPQVANGYATRVETHTFTLRVTGPAALTVYFVRYVSTNASWTSPVGAACRVDHARLTYTRICDGSPSSAGSGDGSGELVGSGPGSGLILPGGDVQTSCCPDDPTPTTLTVSVSGGGPTYTLTYIGFNGSSYTWRDFASGYELQVWCGGDTWALNFSLTPPAGEEGNSFTFVSAVCNPFQLVFTSDTSGKTYTVTP